MTPCDDETHLRDTFRKPCTRLIPADADLFLHFLLCCLISHFFLLFLFLCLTYDTTRGCSKRKGSANLDSYRRIGVRLRKLIVSFQGPSDPVIIICLFMPNFSDITLFTYIYFGLSFSTIDVNIIFLIFDRHSIDLILPCEYIHMTNFTFLPQ